MSHPACKIWVTVYKGMQFTPTFKRHSTLSINIISPSIITVVGTVTKNLSQLSKLSVLIPSQIYSAQKRSWTPRAHPWSSQRMRPGGSFALNHRRNRTWLSKPHDPSMPKRHHTLYCFICRNDHFLASRQKSGQIKHVLHLLAANHLQWAELARGDGSMTLTAKGISWGKSIDLFFFVFLIIGASSRNQRLEIERIMNHHSGGRRKKWTSIIVALGIFLTRWMNA